MIEWLVNKLIQDGHAEDGPELEKAECQEVLDKIYKLTNETYMLIVNVNIESDGFYYDYLLDKADKNTVHIEE